MITVDFSINFVLKHIPDSGILLIKNIIIPRITAPKTAEKIENPTLNPIGIDSLVSKLVPVHLRKIKLNHPFQ